MQGHRSPRRLSKAQIFSLQVCLLEGLRLGLKREGIGLVPPRASASCTGCPAQSLGFLPPPKKKKALKTALEPCFCNPFLWSFISLCTKPPLASAMVKPISKAASEGVSLVPHPAHHGSARPLPFSAPIPCPTFSSWMKTSQGFVV